MPHPHQSCATFKVRVQPRASRNQVDGYDAGTVRVRVTAPPQDGKSNAAVVSLLAEALGVAKSRVRIVRGHTSRNKLVSVESLGPKDLQARIEGLVSGANEL